MTLHHTTSGGRRVPTGKKSGRKVHKKKRKSAVMRWEKYAFLLAGILCMVFAVIGVASLIKSHVAKAAETLTEAVWADLGEDIPFNDGTKAADSGIALYKIDGSNEYAAYVETEEQLKHVVSGLSWYWFMEESENGTGEGSTGEDGTGDGCEGMEGLKTRDTDKIVHFRLAKDIDYNYSAVLEDMSSSGIYNSILKTTLNTFSDGNYSYDSGYCFETDTFDGQGHTVRLTGGNSSTCMILMDASSDKLLSTGILFHSVSDSKIKNLNIVYAVESTILTYNRDESISNPDTVNGLGVGIGVLSGSSNNTIFEDITITAEKNFSVIYNTAGEKFKNKFMQIGVGGITGCMINNVIINRCESDLKILSYMSSTEKEYGATLVSTGAIAGMAIGSENRVNASACRNDDYTLEGEYSDHQLTDKKMVAVSGELLGMVGSIMTHQNVTASVELNDCVLHGEKTRALGARSKLYSETTGWSSGIDNIHNLRCYGEPGSVVYGIENSVNLSLEYDNREITAALGPSETKSSVGISDVDGETGNWFYDSKSGLHLLKDQYRLTQDDTLASGQEVIFAPPEMLDVADGQIRVKGTLQNWMTTEVTKNAKAELYVTWDGKTDPRDSANVVSVITNHPQDAAGTDVEIISPERYEQLKFSEGLVVRARIKVVLNPDTKEEKIYWSGMSERTYTAVDTLIDKPVLKLQEETETVFSELKQNHVYGLGTTQWQLNVAEGKDYDMYWKTFENPNMVLGDSDTETTIKLETMMSVQNYYQGPLSITENMLSGEDSNKIYLYVLAYDSVKTELGETQTAYKLYVFEILAYKADTLMTAIPENGGRIPSGSEVIFRVGNEKEGEYPYSSMNTLVRTAKLDPVPATLAGITGVQNSETKGGAGTEEEPYYLEGRQMITGNPGELVYVYVQPVVNTGPLPENAPEDALPYVQRYASFVQEYQYRIMEKSAVPVISPGTVTTEQSGDAASIEVDAEIYLTANSNEDLIIYSRTADSIEPAIATDIEYLESIDPGTEGYGTSGKIIYYKDTVNRKLYVKNNGIWYEMDDPNDALEVYKDGELFFDLAYENENAYVSVIAFSEGFGYSDNAIYRYKVQEQGSVAEPTALLASGSTVSMGKILNFNSESGTVIFYTVDSREPEIEKNQQNVVTAMNSTKRYDPSAGIELNETDFAYGSTVTIKMFACPVEDSSADEPVFNNKKKSSDTVTFTYIIAEQNQVEAPTSYPETSSSSPASVKNGDQIALACATSGADIYYTTDGNTPDTTDEAQKYTSVITVNGSYGGFFTVKAVSHKAGMKDSAVATFIYQIEEQEVVGDITATPGTRNNVIEGDKIILSASTPGAQIFYTTDGSAPQVETVVNGDHVTYEYSEPTVKYDPASPIVVPEGNGYFLINAIAVKQEMADSKVVQFVYTYADEVGAPYGNPSAGSVTENTEVILLSSTKDAVIYYEIAYGKEPADPTMNSAVFSEKAPIVITKDTVIKAFAVYERESSDIVTLKYSLAEKMQKPSASLSSGSIVPSGTIISFPTSNGTVFYTTDGSDPADPKNASVNSGNSVVITGKAEEKITINACTKKTGATTSEIVTWTYQISKYPGGVTADTESGSTVAQGDMIHLITDVTGGTIRYTTGAGNPVNSGSAGNSVVMDGEPGQEISLKAVAIAPGTTMTGSYAAFQYKLRDQLAAPHASIKTNTVLTEETNLVLKANKGKIYYTIDGSIPDRSSYVYEYPIVLYKDITVQAIAMEEGYENSEVSIFVYTFAEQVSGLTASRQSGTLKAGEVIWLTADDQDAEIYYTTNGSKPNPEAEEGTFLYNPEEGIRVNRDVEINAIAVQNGRSDSDVLSVSYTVSNVPAQDEKLAEAAAAEEEGLQELNTEQLGDRWEQDNNLSDSGLVTVKDVFGDALVKGKRTVLSEDLKLNSKEIAIPENAEEKVQNLLGKEYEFLNNYEFSLYRGGTKIQPDSTVTVGIPIPSGYQDADIFIVYTNDKGQITVFETRREDGYAFADTDYIKNFGLVGAKLEESNSRNLNVILILTIGAGILAAAGMGMIVGMKTKRRKFEES